MNEESLVWPDNDLLDNVAVDGNFISDIDSISEKDYPGRHYFPIYVRAIDLDEYEDSLKKQITQETVDAVIGICNKRQDINVNRRFLLIELKMDCQNAKGLKIKDLLDKISHSKDLISSLSNGIAIDPVYCIIFDPAKEKNLLNQFYRLKKADRRLDHFSPFTPESLNNYVNAGKEPPFTPSALSQNQIKKLKTAAIMGNLENFNLFSTAIITYYRTCHMRQMLAECEFLKNGISEAIQNFNKTVLTEPEDITLLEIITEELEML